MKPIDPLVSVIVPTYNRWRMLPEAIDSCFTQTWPKVEVIVVDDGSTDGTGEAVAKLLGTRWPKDRLIYKQQENRGASAARNHGLQVANGDYIQFLDSDDLLRPTKFENQLRILEEKKFRQAICCTCFGRMGDRALQDSPASDGELIGYCTDDPKKFLRELCSRRVHVMPTCAPLWRRAYLTCYGGWREDIALGDDLEYHARLLAEATQICCVEGELFLVREHSGSRLSTDRMTESTLNSQIKTRRAVLDVVQGAGLWDAQMQSAFLDAMRILYANTLELGQRDAIRKLEEWIWSLSFQPNRQYGFLALILLRMLFGRRMLLGAHRCVKIVRAA